MKKKKSEPPLSTSEDEILSDDDLPRKRKSEPKTAPAPAQVEYERSKRRPAAEVADDSLKLPGKEGEKVKRQKENRREKANPRREKKTKRKCRVKAEDHCARD